MTTYRDSLKLSWHCGWMGLVCLVPAFAPVATNADDQVRFNRDVLPILAEHCYACHGLDKGARKADLRLDQREAATKERDGTRAIVPGHPEESELWARITSSDPETVMPPPKTDRQITNAQREILKRWIEQGAEYEPHWAYLPPKSVVPPEVAGRPQAIDCFIRSRLIQAGIQPSPPADRATLIRRVSLDLTGLPPTPLEVDAFVSDVRPDAYERVVDRLLVSEHYGERWARWWLDLAHYADSDGYLQDFIRPTAWRYRQWVVDALNRDLPFDQFTIEQLAGDLIPDATISQKIATGFLRNTLSNREGGADIEEYRVKQVIDRTVTVSTTWLALTTGCAECHDHKFDSITQREYYQLHAYFNNSDEVNVEAPLPHEAASRRMAQAEYDRKRNELITPVSQAVVELQKEWEQKLLFTEVNPGNDHHWDRQLEVLGLIWGQGQGEGQLEGINIIKTPEEKRTQDQRDRLLDYFLQNGGLINPEKFKELKLEALSVELTELLKSLPKLSRAPAMMQAVLPRATHIHERGDFRRHGEEVQPGIPAAFPVTATGVGSDRLALARWLISPEQPLTARVTVNRLWQELFGRGLVATSENFGVRGDRPSHPDLLDWLAIDFMQHDWSVKQMLRRIVLSETYRQSSEIRSELVEHDPANRLVARQVRLRVSAEGVRDVALAASGLLNPTVGGPAVKPPQPESVSMEGFDNKWETSPGADRYRRGLYTFIQRTSPFAQFVTFDMPETSRTCTRRERSNTPLQALSLLNDPVFVETAGTLAARIMREARNDDQERLNHGFMLTLSRPARPEEAERMLAYLHQQQSLFEQDQNAVHDLLHETEHEGESSEYAAWVAVSSVLLNLDEFITRE